jgi:hypothetical protein
MKRLPGRHLLGHERAHLGGGIEREATSRTCVTASRYQMVLISGTRNGLASPGQAESQEEDRVKRLPAISPQMPTGMPPGAPTRPQPDRAEHAGWSGS